MQRNLYILGLFLLLLGAGHAHAQGVDPVRYLVAPETPGPNQTVLIEAQGVGTFLGSATVTWTQDGAIVKQGVGERTYSFTTRGLGEPTTVRVSISSTQGIYSQTFTFNPSRVHLIWEADTTVPQLYRGKALYSPGSNYKVVAFPTVYSGSARILPSALSYQWRLADEPVANQSGLGRSTFAMTGDQLQAGEDISVDVYYGTKKVGRGQVFISSIEPQILFYQRDALRGVLYDAALPGAISLTGREITVQAEPFYFSTGAQRSGNIPFAWTLNGASTSGPDSARGIITLRQSGSGEGEAQLGVSIQNLVPDHFVQTASANLRLVFGSGGGNPILNFFGL